MNITIDPDGYATILCHNCDQHLSVDPVTGFGEVIHSNASIHCMYCDTHLGFEWDFEGLEKGIRT